MNIQSSEFPPERLSLSEFHLKAQQVEADITRIEDSNITDHIGSLVDDLEALNQVFQQKIQNGDIKNLNYQNLSKLNKKVKSLSKAYEISSNSNSQVVQNLKNEATKFTRELNCLLPSRKLLKGIIEESGKEINTDQVGEKLEKWTQYLDAIASKPSANNKQKRLEQVRAIENNVEKLMAQITNKSDPALVQYARIQRALIPLVPPSKRDRVDEARAKLLDSQVPLSRNQVKVFNQALAKACPNNKRDCVWLAGVLQAHTSRQKEAINKNQAFPISYPLDELEEFVSKVRDSAGDYASNENFSQFNICNRSLNTLTTAFNFNSQAVGDMGSLLFVSKEENDKEPFETLGRWYNMNYGDDGASNRSQMQPNGIAISSHLEVSGEEILPTDDRSKLLNLDQKKILQFVLTAHTGTKEKTSKVPLNLDSLKEYQSPEERRYLAKIALELIKQSSVDDTSEKPYKEKLQGAHEHNIIDHTVQALTKDYETNPIPKNMQENLVAITESVANNIVFPLNQAYYELCLGKIS